MSRRTNPIVWVAVFCALALCPIVGLASSVDGKAVRVEGTVVDAHGAPVAGADVTLEGVFGHRTATTGDDGRFTFADVAGPSGSIRVRARGFEERVREWSADMGDEVALTVPLAPARLDERTTVTASRTETRLDETPASTVILTRDALDNVASPVVDGALRSVAGFRLFRRTDSRVANPTSQGASLRGIGPSGASRVVVLEDGVPLNDPFGGWTVWSRIPREQVRRIEVLRGGGSSLYGTDALGGVVNVLADDHRTTAASLDLSGGSLDTRSVSFAGSLARGGWIGRLAFDAFHTDGYVLVDDRARGAVDTLAGSRNATVSLSIAKEVSDRGRVFARGTYFDESRQNGTPLQTNDTRLRQLAVGGDWRFDLVGSFSARAWTSTQEYDQTFSAIAQDRASEVLTRAQRVPAQQTGAWLVWSRPVGAWLVVVAGVDARDVRGVTDELGFFAGRATTRLESGGRQRALGAFGEALIRLGPNVVVTVGGRADRWRNVDADTRTTALADPASPTIRSYRDRVETAFDPRVQMQWSVSNDFSVRATAYRAFRAPTLNELYRGFRVGNVVTLANADLRAERLSGGEIGARYAPFDGRCDLRATVFWSVLDRPVANLTLDVAPDLITRRRENIGRTRARGVEIDLETRFGQRVRLGGGYVFLDSTVTRFSANPALIGLRVPQTPRHEATVQATVDAPSRSTLAVQARFSGGQFEDDQNRLRLGRAFTVDARVARSFGPVALYVAIENIFDRRVDVGRTPVLTVGPPTSIRFGIRWRPE